MCAAAAWLALPSFAGTLTVTGVQPAGSALDVPVNMPISVTFDQPVDSRSVSSMSFWAFGRWSGTAIGTHSFSNGNQTVTLTPDQPFSPGESVMVILSHDLRAMDGSPLRSAGYSWQFWPRAQSAPRQFAQIDSMSTRTVPTVSTRSYGGIGADLNRDGWLDLTIVNEDSADLRVFMNLADGSGLFDDFIQPPFPVGDRASPSEPSDFNRDGLVDICVANINVNSVSILLGNGDGTYAPQQLVAVGVAPRGIAVLDADGDGDIDIVNTNASSSTMSILLNDGNGVFSAATFFEAGAANEWALAAADMNEDGILDLVIGARNAQSVLVNKGNGNGTFTNISIRPGVGLVWMLNAGDVNGDGHCDVVTANSQSNHGAILLGSGTGQLAAPTLIPTDAFPLGSDIADLDGDGDLDWVTSSFNGDWRVFVNNAAGGFTFDQEINAPSAASCAIPLDFDNDGDVDLALVDELADVVILMKNSGTISDGDIDRDGVVDVNDLLAVIGAWGPCPALPAACPADTNLSQAVDVADLLTVINNWG